MKDKKAIYGFKDKEHAIECVIEDIKFKGMEIIIIASCDGGIIVAPVAMFKILA